MMHFSPPPRTVGTVKGGGGVTTFPTLQRTSPMKSFGNHIRFTGNLANCTTSGAKTVNLGKGFCCRQSSSHKQRKKKNSFRNHFRDALFSPAQTTLPPNPHRPNDTHLSVAPFRRPSPDHFLTGATHSERENPGQIPVFSPLTRTTTNGRAWARKQRWPRTQKQHSPLSVEGCFFFLACLLVLCCDACHSVRAVKL